MRVSLYTAFSTTVSCSEAACFADAAAALEPLLESAGAANAVCGTGVIGALSGFTGAGAVDCAEGKYFLISGCEMMMTRKVSAKTRSSLRSMPGSCWGLGNSGKLSTQ